MRKTDGSQTNHRSSKDFNRTLAEVLAMGGAS
jgi:hypothetical protein